MILDFLELHRAEQNEARHDLMLGLLDRVTHGTDNSGVRLWTLGGPSDCATQTSPRNAIILGELNQSNSPLADETLGLDYPGVLGNDPVVLWFVERALSLATSQTGGRPRSGISRVWPRGRAQAPQGCRPHQQPESGQRRGDQMCRYPLSQRWAAPALLAASARASAASP